MRHICRFTNIAYDPACLTPDGSIPTGSVDRKLSQPVTAAGASWTGHLSTGEAKHIEDRLQTIMDEIGYARYT